MTVLNLSSSSSLHRTEVMQFERNMRNPRNRAEKKLIHLMSPHLNKEQSKTRITLEINEKMKREFL